MYQLLIKNARIIDGTGAPWYRADLAVEDGRIAAIGKLDGPAERVIDAQDRCLAPGFIDIHCHSDSSLESCPTSESRILQGVTTEIGGNCGLSMAPVCDERLELLRGYAGDGSYCWHSVAEFLDFIGARGTSTNFGTLVGHGTVRLAVMGYSDRKATEEQLAQMCALTAQAMRDGAFGLSSGLIYPPGSYADTAELTRVASAIAPYGGYYATHMRNEGRDLVKSVTEALETARGAGVPLQISHHKETVKTEWQVACRTTIAMIARARRNGQDVACDQYPYSASATGMSSNVPAWGFEGGVDALIARLNDPATRARLRDESNASHVGRWGDIHVAYLFTKENEWMIGKSILEIAQTLGKDPADACFDIVVAEHDKVGEVNFGMCEEDIEYIMSQPFTMTGSDGSAMGLDFPGKPHPRNFGAFVRVLAHYSRDRGLFPLETAVHKMTALPASRLRLTDRGALKRGLRADLVLFDPARLCDAPTYEKPQAACGGIDAVFVNGVLTAENGVHTGARAGMILRGSGCVHR